MAPLSSGSRVGEDFDRGKLIASENSGEAEVTGVLISTSRTYSCPPLNHYRTLARAAVCMADGGGVWRRVSLEVTAVPKLPPR
jgi:hypothetical protein